MRWLCLLVFVLGLASPASGQYRFDTWTTEEGLPQNTVTSILQSRDGFLWLTTFGGLVRFDGANMHTFTTVNAPGLRTSRLTGLFEAPDGALWARTEAHGVIRYDRGTFATYGEAEGLPDNVANWIALEGGQVIVETGKGIARWDGARFVPHTRPADGPKPGLAVLGVSRGGATWYRGDNGIYRYERGHLTRTVPGLNPRRVFEDHTGARVSKGYGRVRRAK